MTTVIDLKTTPEHAPTATTVRIAGAVFAALH